MIVEQAEEVINKLEKSTALFTCSKEILPEIISIVDKDYLSGDFQYIIFGNTVHIKRTKKFIKRLIK